MSPCQLGVAVLAVLASACAPDPTAWLRRINAAETRRLEGLWHIEMGTSDRGVSTSGSLALLVNRTERLTRWHPMPAPVSGAYTLPLARLTLDEVGSPHEVTAEAHGDSVTLVLNPNTDGAEIWLKGTWRGDSLTGSWTTRARTGPIKSGYFVINSP